MRIVLAVASLVGTGFLLSANHADARCGEFFDCDPPPEVFDQYDIERSFEDGAEYVVQELFAECASEAAPMQRLGCYDDVLADFGVKVQGVSQ
ncbi:hypothetical protein [Oceaniradius stylonematis]|uniref:hypothetical protein n=1 Tax=Oceaniradius stylonematis TaxID=2184161 RepID=UPI003C7EC2BD